MYKLTILVIGIILISSCTKDPGIGGEATITGKVHALHYNSTFTVLLSEYDLADTYVYLVFGDDINYGTRIKTNYDGEYAFEYLYPGDYTIYTYSIDSAATVNGIPTPPDSAVIRQITISDKNALVETEDLVVFK
ncbi:MAG TPA: hypothetical protein PK511_03625 [Chitinophagales bacterium]|nr:hypothetical protein [Chitinophagales bacterium]HMU69383.1 hypothetical protein [Chitinophagales bacterium]HMX03718.1 hypothetical protein [Chitinophagales bacterium]HMZ88441.1 hypothetical protein [Chitinophagales bacterium]HNA57463.1 hypothetical protein [Chitinophagales bacterium]